MKDSKHKNLCLLNEDPQVRTMGQSARPGIGILMADPSNPFWMDMKRHYDRLAEERGLCVDCIWPMPPHDPPAQSKTLLTMIASGYQVIIVNPMTNNNLVSAIEQASLKGIPILDVGAKTDRRLLPDTPLSYLPIPTVDFFAQGKLAAQYIVKNLGSGDPRTVVILEGRPDSAQSLGRSSGAAEVFQTSPCIQWVIRMHANFDRRTATRVTKQLYHEGTSPHAFFCVNDSMALGVSDALAHLINAPRPLVVGVDLIGDAKKAIKEGLLSASVAFSRSAVAALALEMAHCCIHGLKTPPLRPVTSYLVTHENVHEFTD